MPEREVIANPADKMLSEMYPKNMPAGKEPATEKPESSLIEGEAQAESAQEAAEEAETPEVRSDENVPESASDEAPAADDGDSDDEATDEVELSTFDQLAEHLETDPEFLQGLTIKQKVNGQEVDVVLSEALATHRKVTAADEYLTEAKAKRSEILQEANAQKESIGETAAAFGAMLKDLQDTYKQQVDNVDWAGLRADDPAEYAAKKQEFAEMQERIASFQERGRSAYQNYAKQQQEQQQRVLQERLPEEFAKLTRLLPEWRDDKKASQERAAVAEYLTKEGLTEQEIQAAAYNATVLSMAVKAMRYDKAQGKKDVAKKRVLKIPKVTKPGTKPDESSKPKPSSDDRASILYG